MSKLSKDEPYAINPVDPKVIREFETGATRDTEDGKLDFEAFFSPAVLLKYAEYMNEHRTQKDGKVRAGDNWQKGIPRDAYMKSMMRHFMDVWLAHRGEPGHTEPLEEALCALLFNAMGYLFNVIEDKP